MNSGWGVHCKGIICHTPSAAFTDSPYKVLIGYIIFQNGRNLYSYVSPNTPTKGYGQCACMVCLYRIRAQPFLHILDFFALYAIRLSRFTLQVGQRFPPNGRITPTLPPCAGASALYTPALLRFLLTHGYFCNLIIETVCYFDTSHVFCYIAVHGIA